MIVRHFWPYGAISKTSNLLYLPFPERARLPVCESPSAAHSADSERCLPGVSVHLLLVSPAGEVLFGRRDAAGCEGGLWSLPSGPLGPGESVTAALVRKAREAIAVTVDEEAAAAAHVMHDSSDGGRLAFFFVVSSWRGEPGNREPGKCSGLAWFSLGALPYHLAPSCRAALEWIAAGQWFSTYGW